MAHKFTSKVLTANDLLQGDVIYFGRDGGWTRTHAQAELIEDAARADALLASVSAQAGGIVGPYLANAVTGIDGAPQPAHFRETFRARGPSNYAHGKQSEQPG
jgi:uncharacterized protein DUF2849